MRVHRRHGSFSPKTFATVGLVIAFSLVAALVADPPVAHADGRGARIIRRFRPGTRATSARMDPIKYQKFKRGGLELLRRYPLDTHYILGIGRSPVGPVTFLKLLGIKGKGKSGDLTPLASSIPMSGIGDGAPPVDPALYPEYFRHIERFLPPDVLAGRRTVVLVDTVLSGDSARHFATVLKAYWASKRVHGEVILSGFYLHGNSQPADFDLIGHAFDYGVHEPNGGSVGEYDGSHPISNQPGGRLEDLRPNPRHATFRALMAGSMEADEDLDDELVRDFARYLAPARRAAAPPAHAAR